MAQNYSLPKPTEPLLDQFGKVSVPWYNYLRTRFGDGAAEEIIASIEAQIAGLIARVEALEEGESAVISGPESVRVVGTLAGGLVQLTLEGDDRSPPPTYYYGTNAVEVKGFHPVADTIIQSDGITLTVNADGTTNIAHADTSSVADISANFTGGTVPDEISFTFDQFGHVLTRTITGRTLDHNDTGALQGGSATERYHFTEAEHTGLLPWSSEDPGDYALITQTITNGDTTHAPSGDAVFDALAGKEPTIAAGTTAQVWRGDKTWQNWIDGDFRLGQSAGLAGNGRELAISVGASTNTLARIGLLGNRTGAGNFGAFQFYNSAAAGSPVTASLAATTDGADDSGAFLIAAKPAGSALVNVLQISYNTVRPRTDNTISCGIGAARWTEVFAATGTINTSDARKKTIRGPLTETELSAAAELASIGVIYQWNDAIELKGDDARWHFGPTVQAVIAVMERHGLDPFRYAFICYDKWSEQAEALDDSGEVVQEYRPAGDRYSLRHDQLLLFIARGQEERLRRLESLLGT